MHIRYTPMHTYIHTCMHACIHTCIPAVSWSAVLSQSSSSFASVSRESVSSACDRKCRFERTSRYAPDMHACLLASVPTCTSTYIPAPANAGLSAPATANKAFCTPACACVCVCVCVYAPATADTGFRALGGQRARRDRRQG